MDTKVSKKVRKIPCYIVLTGETYDDYKDIPENIVIEEFITYYDIKREDFTITIKK
ncbi:MAG TPA: hypothetical protein P5513_05820 [Candidatus Diapherotrites archaeon]|nr:hypothetical protein [Candidatus Diapherotrites archaeon]